MLVCESGNRRETVVIGRPVQMNILGKWQTGSAFGRVVIALRQEASLRIVSLPVQLVVIF